MKIKNFHYLYLYQTFVLNSKVKISTRITLISHTFTKKI